MYFCTKITDDVTWIGVNDRKTERFENYIPLPHGVTYNSYFIDDEKTCVIDGVEISQSSEFLDKIYDCLNGRKLDYIIVNHVEPDHSSGLKEVIKIFPEIKVVGNPKTLGMLKSFCIDFPEENYVVIKNTI